MVAPSGSTKDETRLSTPALFSTQAIVSGKVPFDDAELNAVRRAGESAFAYAIGSRRATNFRMSGSTNRA